MSRFLPALVLTLSGVLAGGHLEAAENPVFRESARELGLDFHHFIGATGEFHLPEIMGSGVGLLDYDGDGDLDVYLIQGAMLDPSKTLPQSLFPFPGRWPPRNRLFRNQLKETGRLGFIDATGAAGVGHEGYGMGLAVGDYDADGDLDLYLTNFGPNVLYRNRGDGTFQDVTRDAGVDDPRFSTSATFLDYDADGDLDLYVANYVSFTVRGNKACGETRRDYCSPSVYEPVPDRLFRNLGDGRFEDASEEAGLGVAFGAGLGVITVDANRDRRLDLYVANDGTPNQLWINDGKGGFEDFGLMSGVAYNADGVAEAGMGVTAADFDGDGDEDLFVTHNQRETNTLYLSDLATGFTDATSRFALAQVSVPYTGFGTLWFDYDHDGWLDLFVANGAVTVDENQPSDSAYPYAQKNQLFRNHGRGEYGEVAASAAGAGMDLVEVSRGAAFGDLDDDGDVDVVLATNNGPARLLLNRMASGSRWLGVRLVGEKSPYTGIDQASVVVLREGLPPLLRRCRTDGSYLSAHDGRILFGLGEAAEIKGVAVEWPAGRCEIWSGIISSRYVTLRRGSGRPCGSE